MKCILFHLLFVVQWTPFCHKRRMQYNVSQFLKTTLSPAESGLKREEVTQKRLERKWKRNCHFFSIFFTVSFRPINSIHIQMQREKNIIWSLFQMIMALFWDQLYLTKWWSPSKKYYYEASFSWLWLCFETTSTWQNRAFPSRRSHGMYKYKTMYGSFLQEGTGVHINS